MLGARPHCYSLSIKREHSFCGAQTRHHDLSLPSPCLVQWSRRYKEGTG